MAAPIVLFVYKRLKHLEMVIDRLKKNELAEESELYIYSDAAKDSEAADGVGQVREYLKTIDGFASVTICERECNYGIEKSEIEGITEVINKHGRAVILEDDVITNEAFLCFMNEALDRYERDLNVFSVTGYAYLDNKMKGLEESAYFLKLPSVWGWATWSNRWEQFIDSPEDMKNLLCDKSLQYAFNYDNAGQWYELYRSQYENAKKITWDLSWYWTVFKHDGLTLYPAVKLSENIGTDGSGTHGVNNSERKSSLGKNIVLGNLPSEIEENIRIRKKIKRLIAARGRKFGYIRYVIKKNFKK